MFKKEITAAFIENCPLSGAFAFRCTVSEGISLPFRAEVTLFSDSALTPEDLESCLLMKTELSLMQYDTTGTLCRGRKYQGVITSYNALGLISDLEGYEPMTDCYGYEIIIEPEMVLMGLDPRTRSFSSEKTPAEIITEIFGEYNQKCRFDPGLFDRMPDHGQIAQQNNETDLNFINRICFNYGFNYTFELESPEDEFSAVSVVFSRGYCTGNSHEITGNTHTGLSEIPCLTGKTGNRLFGDRSVFLDRLVRTGIAGSGSIRRNSGALRNGVPFFRNGFEPVRGEGSHPGESIYAFGKESSIALDRLSRNRTLISARDFAVASGIVLDTGTTRYLTVRVRFGFNLNFPKTFRGSRSYPENEDELNLTAVAVPIPENSTETLGPLCCFGPIPENPTAATAFAITDIPRPGRSSRTAGASDLRSSAVLKEENGSNAMIVQATVCDKSGVTLSTSGTTTVCPGMIVTSDNDNTAFPAMFYALPDGNSAKVIEVNYVSMSGSAAPLGNFPKIGEKVLLLYTGSSYYFMGYLPNSNALSTYCSELRNDLLHSSFLSSGYDPDSSAASAGTDRVPTNENRDIDNQYFSFSRFSSSRVLVEYIIMQKRLKEFLDCLAYKFDTHKITEIYDDYKSKASTCLSNIITSRQKLDDAVKSGSGISDAQQELTTAYNSLSETAGSIVDRIKGVSTVSSQLSSLYNEAKTNNSTRYTGSENAMKEQILGDLLGTVSGDLFYDGTHRVYGSRLENAVSDDITSIADGNINLHAGKKICITADDSIQLQVGNNSIKINGNTIAMAVAYFKTSLSPWDAKISLSPTSGVSISGYQFSASGLFSASVADNFGGCMSTKSGMMTLTAPKIKITNMGNIAIIKTLAKLACNTAMEVGNAIAACPDYDNSDAADKAARIINNIKGYLGSGIGMVADAATAIQLFSRSIETGVKNVRAWESLAVSLILVALDAADTIESIIADSMLESKAKDNVFVERNKDNNYISGRDIYLMVTSGLRMATLIANDLFLMGDNLISSKTSSAELMATGVTISGNDIALSYTNEKIMASAIASKNVDQTEKADQTENVNQQPKDNEKHDENEQRDDNDQLN